MSMIDRRKFLKIVGGSTAAIGMGMALPMGVWGQTGAAGAVTSDDPKFPNWSDWEYFYPGKYDKNDTKILKAFKSELNRINTRGNVSIGDLVSGKLADHAGIGRTTQVTAEMMKNGADTYGADNPMWLDTGYAEKTKWGAMMIPFNMSAQMGVPALPKSDGIGDYMVVSNYNCASSYYRPVYEGDTLYTVTDRSDCVDITPTQGSYYRTFALIGWGRTYNQKGELVNEAAGIRTESFRRRKAPSKRHPKGIHAWESPDWWQRPRYRYTDSDWDEIISIWKNETIRGSETLYWDDVNIGDEPPARAVGPIITDMETDILMSSKLSTDLKQQVLEPNIFSGMKKTEYGIWVMPDFEKKAASEPPTTTAGGVPELGNRDDRCVLMNAVAAYWAGGMILNWMGNDGWLQRIGWDIMELPPGTSKVIDFEKDPTVIPKIPMELRPALFDKYPYLEKVPGMRDKRAAWHALEGDLIISRAVVTGKHRKGNECFVELVWWCETFDKYLVEEGFATVKLPTK